MGAAIKHPVPDGNRVKSSFVILRVCNRQTKKWMLHVVIHVYVLKDMCD